MAHFQRRRIILSIIFLCQGIAQMVLSLKDGWEIAQTTTDNWPLIGATLTSILGWWEQNQWTGFVAIIGGLIWLVWSVSRPLGLIWPKVSMGDTSPEATVLLRYLPDIKQSTLELNQSYSQLQRDARALAKTMDNIQALAGFYGWDGFYRAILWYLKVKMPRTAAAIQSHSNLFQHGAETFLRAHQGLVADYPDDVPVSNSVWAILWGAQAQVGFAKGMEAVLVVLGEGLQQLHDSRRMGQLDRPVNEMRDAIASVRNALEKVIEVKVATEPLFQSAMSVESNSRCEV